MNKLFTQLKIWLFRQLFTENEKCILNQALNLQIEEINKDSRTGLCCDYKQDINDVEILLKMCENKLWN